MTRVPSIRELERRNDPNVVILPTAARRQVQQNYNESTRAERRRLREENPWPGQHLYPGQRRAIENAKLVQEVERTPELAMLLAIFAALDPETRAKVDEQLALMGIGGCRRVRQAQALLSIRTLGDRLDSDFAFRYLEGES